VGPDFISVPLLKCVPKMFILQAVMPQKSAGVHTGCHDVAVHYTSRASVDTFAQASTKEPADARLQGDAVLDPALVNGTRMDVHVFATSGSVGCAVH
jgi:hypothetical protein